MVRDGSISSYSRIDAWYDPRLSGSRSRTVPACPIDRHPHAGSNHLKHFLHHTSLWWWIENSFDPPSDLNRSLTPTSSPTGLFLLGESYDGPLLLFFFLYKKKKTSNRFRWITLSIYLSFDPLITRAGVFRIRTWSPRDDLKLLKLDFSFFTVPLSQGLEFLRIWSSIYPNSGHTSPLWDHDRKLSLYRPISDI